LIRLSIPTLVAACEIGVEIAEDITLPDPKTLGSAAVLAVAGWTLAPLAARTWWAGEGIAYHILTGVAVETLSSAGLNELGSVEALFFTATSFVITALAIQFNKNTSVVVFGLFAALSHLWLGTAVLITSELAVVFGITLGSLFAIAIMVFPIGSQSAKRQRFMEIIGIFLISVVAISIIEHYVAYQSPIAYSSSQSFFVQDIEFNGLAVESGIVPILELVVNLGFGLGAVAVIWVTLFNVTEKTEVLILGPQCPDKDALIVQAYRELNNEFPTDPDEELPTVQSVEANQYLKSMNESENYGPLSSQSHHNRTLPAKMTATLSGKKTVEIWTPRANTELLNESFITSFNEIGGIFESSSQFPENPVSGTVREKQQELAKGFLEADVVMFVFPVDGITKNDTRFTDDKQKNYNLDYSYRYIYKLLVIDHVSDDQQTPGVVTIRTKKAIQELSNECESDGVINWTILSRNATERALRDLPGPDKTILLNYMGVEYEREKKRRMRPVIWNLEEDPARNVYWVRRILSTILEDE